MSKKGKGKGKRKVKDIDWAADANFDKNRAMVYIEHTFECPIFAVKAEEFVRFLQAQIPERMFQLVRNQNGKLSPRAGAFEIDFAQTARTSAHNLWSGLEKGPPRRDKFPEFQSLLPEVRAVLKKFYAEKKPEEDLIDEEELAAAAAMPPPMHDDNS